MNLPNSMLGSNGDAIDADDYYYHQGQKLSIYRSRTEGVVRLRSGAAKMTTSALATNLGSQVTITKRINVRGQEFAIVQLSKGKDGAQAQATLRTLASSPTVVSASPLFIHPQTGTRMMMTDDIIVKLSSDVHIEELMRLQVASGLTVVKKMEGVEDEYVLRIQDPQTTNALAIANAMVESGLVQWAEPNFVQDYQKSSMPNDPLFPSQWHLHNSGQGGGSPDADVDAPEAWDLQTGNANTVIAIIDDGVQTTHPDLAPNIFTNPGEIANNGIDDDGNGYIDDVQGWDFRNGDNNPNPALVNDNHGTAVAGVAAARGNNAVGVSGACQGCRILPVKIADGNGFTDSVTIAEAIRYAASFADILNNSWGGGSPSNTIQSAIRDATTNGRGGKGSVVFFATGNSASGHGLATISGFPAGTHRIRWTYAKDGSVHTGNDTAWIAWVQLPGGELVDFVGGSLPAGWRAGGNAPWSSVNDPVHSDEGLCLSHAAKAGSISHNQSSYLEVVKAVPSGNLSFYIWISSEFSFDGVTLTVDLGNDGTTDFTSSLISGNPFVRFDPSFPAAHPEAIAVGASTNFDCRSGYSQFGATLDFVAPSGGGPTLTNQLRIATTDRTGSNGYHSSSYTPNGSAGFSGTSSATPLAAGIAGLILSQNPSLTQEAVREIMQDTADKVGLEPYNGAGRNNRYGFGRLNALRALQGARAVLPTQPTQNDFNHDGRSDILWRHMAVGSVHLWQMNGNVISGGGDIATVADLNWRIERVGDFNNDGRADILWRHAVAGIVHLWLMNGTAVIGGGTVAQVADLNWRIERVGDFNNDGNVDILWRHAVAGIVHLWLMNGTAVIGGGNVAQVADLNWHIERVGDFNNDGRVDILWRHAASGNVHLWLMNGTAVIGGGDVAQVADLNWHIERVGDFNNDGNVDILWRHAVSGNVHLWLMNGTAVIGGGDVAQVADLNWHIERVGDFNNDGSVDILWRHAIVGALHLWLMNGNIIVGGGSIATVADLNWTIQ